MYQLIHGDCIEIGMREERHKTVRTFHKEDVERFPWLTDHMHAEGPYGFILTGIRKFLTPITYQGSQGIFEIPDDVVSEQLDLC